MSQIRQPIQTTGESRPPEPQPPRRADVVALAILDLIAIVIILVAASVLALNADTVHNGWWWGVAAASLTAVWTTVHLGRIWDQRRSFIEDSLRLADYLEELKKPEPGRSLDAAEFSNLRSSAVARRDAARASGDVAIEHRLTVALAKVF
jgi:hypothetical protein